MAQGVHFPVGQSGTDSPFFDRLPSTDQHWR